MNKMKYNNHEVKEIGSFKHVGSKTETNENVRSYFINNIK
jgi:hypothetical protein